MAISNFQGFPGIIRRKCGSSREWFRGMRNSFRGFIPVHPFLGEVRWWIEMIFKSWIGIFSVSWNDVTESDGEFLYKEDQSVQFHFIKLFSKKETPRLSSNVSHPSIKVPNTLLIHDYIIRDRQISRHNGGKHDTQPD